MEKSKHALGEEHSDTLRSMSNLAVTYSGPGPMEGGRGAAGGGHGKKNAFIRRGAP
jgi:hypothetical protein